MKFRSDPFLAKCILLMVLILIWASMSGCAAMTEEYWQEKYESMTAEEIEAAKAGPDMVTICDLTDCIIIWVE